MSQRWALHQESYEPLCILSFHFTLRQLECDDASPRVASSRTGALPFPPTMLYARYVALSCCLSAEQMAKEQAVQGA